MNKIFIPTRYKMVAGTFLLAMIVLFDRILISVAKDPIAADLSLSDKQMGWLFTHHVEINRAIWNMVENLDREKYRKLMSEERYMELMQLVKKRSIDYKIYFLR